MASLGYPLSVFNKKSTLRERKKESLLQNNNNKTKHKNTHFFKTTFMCLRSIAGVPLIRSGASGLTYYCAPLVCVSDVMELQAVWRHNKPKTKKPASPELPEESKLVTIPVK